MNIHNKCLVCESDNLIPFKGYYRKHGLIKCLNCGFIFMERIPTAKELEAHYANYSYKETDIPSTITVKRYNQLLDEFEKYRKTNRLLDVGCGRGWFLLEAQKRNWKVYGTEFAKEALTLCSEKGISMKDGELDPTKFEFSDFDVITSFEVIEHINNPNKELAAISSLLRVGGLFYCTTPNFNSLLRYYLKSDYNIIEYPEHLSYYTKSTLIRVAKRNALKPVKFKSTGFSINQINSLKENLKGTLTVSSDEKLRKNLEGKWYLKMMKSTLNKIFTWTNSGMILKGYFIKN